MVTPCPFLRLRRVDRGREDAGKAVQKNARDRSNSHRSGEEGKGRVESAPPPASSKALSLVDPRAWSPLLLSVPDSLMEKSVALMI